MEVLYYWDDALRECPVKRYLEQYTSDNCNKLQERNLRILVDVNNKVCFIRDNDGLPIGGIAKKLTDYDFFEIRQGKDRKTLIRICYCIYQNKMVLLYAFEKPNKLRYGKKENQDLANSLIKADEYYKKFINNPNNHEEYK